MIKTIYLNFDLGKEEELEAYHFLDSLGRAKKKFVIAILMKHRFLDSLEEKGKRVLVARKEERKQLDSKELPSIEQKLPLIQQPVAPYLLEKQTIVQSTQVDSTDWHSYFTSEQVQQIQVAGHDMSIAKPNMLRSMREHMENGVPVGSAYSIAAFDNYE